MGTDVEDEAGDPGSDRDRHEGWMPRVPVRAGHGGDRPLRSSQQFDVFAG
jgi:hypothetical protein